MQEIRPRFFCDFIFFQVFAFFIMKKGGNAGNVGRPHDPNTGTYPPHPQHGYPPVLGWLVLGWANPLTPRPPNLGVRVAHVGFFGRGEWEGAISE